MHSSPIMKTPQGRMSWWRTGRIFFRFKVEFLHFSSLDRYSVTSIWRPPWVWGTKNNTTVPILLCEEFGISISKLALTLDSMMLGSTVWCYCVSSPLLLYYSVALPSLPIIAHANSVGCPLSFHLIQVHRLSPVRCLHAFLIAIVLHSS